MAIKKIAVLTSGGDAPGMNACIRAVSLAAIGAGAEVIGYKYGYNGLLKQEYIHLDPYAVRNLLQRGGTVLHSARCEKFKQTDQLHIAAQHLNDAGVDGLVVVGGDGSFKGAERLQSIWDKPIVGVPGTIDNDVAGTDYTVGYHTAIQTAVESLDKVRDTAEAFERIFVVDVMGREAGFIALNSAISAGADHVLLPETFTTAAEELVKILDKLDKRRKNRANKSHIIVVTENLWPGGLNVLADSLQAESGVDVRILTLGHVQRGGSPVWQDRLLATKLGTYAVEIIKQGQKGMMSAINHRLPAAVPLNDVSIERKELNSYSMQIRDEISLLG
ncbi:ATP-dependent 6-phosphofructokinase [Agaribacter flavus]|uniref:6-phosphofructokinase n=1 Tax=Agaribacter flavus TaxID=1902781 RepID=A0ABV7FIH9_9ALTE